MTDLDRLIEAVEAGNATFNWCLAASPSRKALPKLWHAAMNAYLGSLDAAVALKNALLPEWDFRLETHGDDACALVFETGRMDDFIDEWVIVPDRQLSIALLLATLKAYRERMNG